MVKRGDRWVLLREHPTRAAALAHLRALYANVPEARRGRSTGRRR